MIEIVGHVKEAEGEEVSESLVERALSVAVRNTEEATEAFEPTNNQVWLFSYSTATALIAMLCISFMHRKSRRLYAPQLIGLAMRLLAIASLMTAVPIAGRGRVTALPLLFIVAGLVSVSALWEFFWSTLDEHVIDKSSLKTSSGEECLDDDREVHFPPGLRTAMSLMPHHTSVSGGKVPFSGYSLH